MERPGAQLPSRPDASALRFALLGGARGSSDLVSPQLVLAAAYGFGTFELGVSLAASPNTSTNRTVAKTAVKAAPRR